MSIHPRAIIDPAAMIGDQVTIGPGAIIEANVVIGNGCVIGPNAIIKSFTSMGDECRVHSGAVIGDTPQDLSFKQITSYVRIGSRNVFREGVTIHRGTAQDSETTVGNDCYLMANSHLAHNVKLGDKVILANGALLGGYVQIGSGVFISGNAVIHQFCRIGRLAMIGGVCGISKDVPPFCMTRSGTINMIIGLNIVGLRRNGFSAEQRKNVRTCFNILYRKNLNVTQAVDMLESMTENAVALEFRDFIQSAKRGICRISVRSGEENASNEAE